MNHCSTVVRQIPRIIRFMLFEKMLQVFGIVFEEEVLDEDIEKLIEERQAARANKDFATADRIRDELAAQGIKLLDTKEGVRWTRD